MIDIALWLTFSTRKGSFHMFLFCTGILFILLLAETGVLLFHHSTSRRESRISVLILPLSLTRTSILAFALGTGIPLWWSITSSLLGFFSLFPMLTVLQIYEVQEQTWENLVETIFLLKDTWYRKQGATWRRTCVEARTVLHAGYRNWKSGLWFVSQAVVAGTFVLLSPIVVLSSYFGWLLVTTITHAG